MRDLLCVPSLTISYFSIDKKKKKKNRNEDQLTIAKETYTLFILQKKTKINKQTENGEDLQQWCQMYKSAIDDCLVVKE